jgi:hypothetical protein
MSISALGSTKNIFELKFPSGDENALSSAKSISTYRLMHDVSTLLDLTLKVNHVSSPATCLRLRKSAVRTQSEASIGSSCMKVRGFVSTTSVNEDHDEKKSIETLKSANISATLRCQTLPI